MVIIIITKHILYTCGMTTFISYLILRNSSQLSIIEYVWFQKHIIVFKPIGIKHLPMLCHVLKYTKTHKTQSLLSRDCHAKKEREMHMEPGDWMSF